MTRTTLIPLDPKCMADKQSFCRENTQCCWGIPVSSKVGRRCADEDRLLEVCREFPRATIPSSAEAVASDVSASNCRCRVLSNELRTLAACSGKCSANAPNALHSYSTEQSLGLQQYSLQMCN